MKRRYAYHVFAHDGDQYRTIQSGGISPSESRSLEQFFFGQTNDSAYLDALEREPGVIWRRLGPNPALTRVVRGRPDANRRATLRFETIILPEGTVPSPEQFPRLVTGKWEFQEDRVDVSPADEYRGALHPQRIADVLMNGNSGERVVARAEDYSLMDVGKMIVQRAKDPQFALAFKSLNPAAPVVINLVARASGETVTPPGKSIVARTGGQAVSTVRSTPRQSQTPHGVLVPALLGLLVLLDGFQIWSRSGSPDAGSFDTTVNTIQNNIIRNLTDRADALSQEIAASKTATDAELGKAQDALEDSIGAAQDEITELQSHLTTMQNDITALRSKVDSYQRQANDGYSSIRADSEELKGLVRGISEQNGKRHKDIEELRADLGALSGWLHENIRAIHDELIPPPQPDPPKK